MSVIVRYDSTSGVFTVPPGGDGIYYFSTYLLGSEGEFGEFDIRLNDDIICTTYLDHSHNGDIDYAPGSCSAVIDVVVGKQCLISVSERFRTIGIHGLTF